MTSSSNGPVASNGTRIVLRDMTRADIRAVRRIESVAYDDAWPSRAFDAELANAFARYRVAIEEPAPASDQPERAATLGVQGVLGAIATLRRRLTRRTRPDRIVGFIGVWYMQDQMHLVTIAVDPAQQGRGIGARLLLECMDLAREAELPEVVLEVRVTNERAKALYERFGFRRAGTLLAYYQDNGEDAHVMLSGSLDTPESQLRHATIRDALRERGVFADLDTPRPPIEEMG